MDRRTLLATGFASTISLLSGCSGVFGRNSSSESITVQGVSVGPSTDEEMSVYTTGTATLLDFFATWCAPCKPQMTVLRTVRESFDQESLSMLSITQESDEEAIREFWREYDGTWPVGIDTDLDASREYDVNSIPTLIVLSADGAEQFRHVGLASEQQLLDAVNRTIDESEN